jgi:TolB-like protein/Tfp pilus assembly protein PilF
VLYELVSGRKAFEASDQASLIAAILERPPLPLREPQGQIPPALEVIVMRCLHKQPAERFQSAGEVLSALQAIAAPSAAVAAPTLAGSRARVLRRFRPALLSALAASALVALALWRRQATPEGRVLLAVLPFQNLSGDPAQDYLSDGFTEEMIATLGRLHPERLGVIARTSAMRFKGPERRIADIARELRVAYVLEGSLRRAGERLRITAQLIDVKDQTQAWTQSYDRELGNALSVQDDVARAVAAEVRLKLAPDRRARARPVDPRAEDAYLRGRFHWNQRNEEGFRKAIAAFEEAVRADPSWALPYSGLADAYLSRFDYELGPPAEASAGAQAAVQKALELDAESAPPHASLGHLRLHEWDWTGAEREFRRALELDPSYVTAHHWYALCLTTLGRTEEAVAAMQRARELNPLSVRINGDLGMALHAAGRSDEAIAQERKTLELEPNFDTGHWIMGMAYEQKGDRDEAIRSYQEALKHSPDDPDYLAALAHCYAGAGRTKEARAIVAKLLELSKREAVSPFCLALVYAGLGDRDEAIAWLEKAYAQRSGSVRYLRVEKRLDPLRADPRFHDLLRRMNLG